MKTWTLSVVVLAAACSGITTNARLSPGANVAQYHTFSWAPQAGNHPETPGDQAVRSSIERNLAAKGLALSTSGPADFLVDYHTKTQQKTEVYGGYGYGWYGGYGGYPDINTYTEGTLIVDFVDPKEHKIFWRGTASAVVNHPDNPDPTRIDDAVTRLVEKYPAQMAAVPRENM